MTDSSYDKVYDYPYKIYRFKVVTETEHIFRVYSDDPTFSEQEFASFNDRDKFIILKELPDVDESSRTIWTVTRYRGEVNQWQG